MEKVYDAYGVELKVGDTIAWLHRPAWQKCLVKGKIKEIRFDCGNPRIVVRKIDRPGEAGYWAAVRDSVLISTRYIPRNSKIYMDRVISLEKGKPKGKGRVHIYRNSERKMVWKQEIEEYLKQGWILGRPKRSA